LCAGAQGLIATREGGSPLHHCGDECAYRRSRCADGRSIYDVLPILENGSSFYDYFFIESASTWSGLRKKYFLK
jgi:hypothetical protein